MNPSSMDYERHDTPYPQFFLRSFQTFRSFIHPPCEMTDRRRINGPASGTSIPTFIPSEGERQNARRTRKPNQLRKICGFDRTAFLVDFDEVKQISKLESYLLLQAQRILNLKLPIGPLNASILPPLR